MADTSVFFQSAPVEVILQIVGQCSSTRDTLSLVSTCRRLREIWRTHTAVILWPLWRREIPHFEHALLAARSTQLVLDAENRGELPSMDISPGTLSGDARVPRLTELQTARDLHRLAQALATIFSQQCDIPPSPPRQSYGDDEDEYPAAIYRWESQVHKAVYRVLIAGAALAGAYHEPLFKAKEHTDPAVSCLPNTTWLKQEQFSFFKRFAVSDMESLPEEEEAVFGRFGDWLLHDIMSDRQSRAIMLEEFDDGCNREFPKKKHFRPCLRDWENGGDHPDAHLVTWELMQMLWVCERIGYAAWMSNSDFNLARQAIQYPWTHGWNKTNAEQAASSTSRVALAVLFGSFRAHKIYLPNNATHGQDDRLAACLANNDANMLGGEYQPFGRTKKRPVDESVASFFEQIFCLSGCPNHLMLDDGELTNCPIAPLELKFFEYFLRQRLRMCFKGPAFLRGLPSDRQTRFYDDFLDSFKVFSHDEYFTANYTVKILHRYRYPTRKRYYKVPEYW